MNTVVSVASLASASVAPEIAAGAPAEGSVWPAGAGTDARLFVLWERWLASRDASYAAWEKLEDAMVQLPDWAKAGPECIDSGGEGHGLQVGWPAIELSPPEIAEIGHLRMIRPSPDYIEATYKLLCSTHGKPDAEKWRRRMRTRLAARLLARRDAEAKLNIPALKRAHRAAHREADKIEAEIRALAPATPNFVAAIVLLEVREAQLGIEDTEVRLLRALRPQLTGVFAEEAGELIDNAFTGEPDEGEAAAA